MLVSESDLQTHIKNLGPFVNNQKTKNCQYIILNCFSTTSRVIAKYLRNKTRYGQSENGVINYKGLPTFFQNYMDSLLQKSKSGLAFYPDSP